MKKYELADIATINKILEKIREWNGIPYFSSLNIAKAAVLKWELNKLGKTRIPSRSNETL